MHQLHGVPGARSFEPSPRVPRRRRSIVATPNEFWIALNALAQAYDAEGMTPEERTANILDEFAKMPPTVRRTVLDNARRMATHLPHLFLAARAKAQELDTQRSKEAAG